MFLRPSASRIRRETELYFMGRKRVRSFLRIAQKPQQSSLQLVWRRQFTFPDNDDLPAGLPERFHVLFIARHVPAELCLPEVLVSFRACAIFASRMAMPEAPMHKHSCSPLRENDVRLAREIFAVKAEPKSYIMKKRTNLDLGRRVPAPDAAHVPTSSGLIESIHGTIPTLERVSELWRLSDSRAAEGQHSLLGYIAQFAAR